MANMNFGTPKFFPDVIAYHRGRGSTIWTVTATGGSGATATRVLQSGTAHELFDLRPLNTVSFDTGGDTDSQVLINVALSSASFKNFWNIFSGSFIGSLVIFSVYRILNTVFDMYCLKLDGLWKK